jgi:hypothetical protein
MSLPSTSENLRGTRSGFTLLELITAMLASTVLVASLAATVVISTELMKTPPNDQDVWHDREIADRLAGDLRYATEVNEAVGYGFEITKPDSTSGSPETASYESYMDGLTRRVGSGPIMNLDPAAPGHVFSVDGYSAPTYVASDKYVRLRSSSTAATAGAVPSLDIRVPPGCKPGDLVLLCISAKTPSQINISSSGWQSLRLISGGDLRLITIQKTYDATWSDTMTISVTPDSAIAAAMLTIENVDPTSPISWTDAAVGYAFSFLPVSHPTPLEPTTISKRDLNVQIFAADLDPWNDGALGMAGYTDAAQATAAQDNFLIRNTIGISIRNGGTPALSTAPSLLHQTSGVWLQTAVRVEVEP